MKKVFLSILITISILIVTGCNKKIDEIKNNNISDEVTKSMKAIINDKEYIINLEDNF